MSLKKKDYQLLYELDANAALPYSLIGKKLKMSQQLISHKINQFAKKKIIQHFCTLIDYSKLGYHAFTVFFNVYYRNHESFEKIIKQIKQQENILSIKECDGKYDLIVEFAAKNPSSFNKKLKQLTFSIVELKERTILTNIVTHTYYKDYFLTKNHLAKKDLGDIIISGDREEMSLDSLNLKILSELALKKKKIVELSASLKISSKTILSRIKWLEQKKVIKGYRAQLNCQALGIFVNLILIRYNDAAFEQEAKFTYFCKSNPNITELIKTFGEWDALLCVETKSLQEFRNIFLQIRETFDEIIEEIDSLGIHGVPERKYFPQSAMVNLSGSKG